MQLLLIKPCCYIFISIRLLIPQYKKKKTTIKKKAVFHRRMEDGARQDGV